MSTAIADTSVFIARESGRPLDTANLPDEIAVSVVTVAELRAGVLVADDPDVRARRLRSVELARRSTALPIDDAVGRAWAQLRLDLRRAKQRMPVNDSWIAATALRNDMAVLTQDDDFAVVPSLDVIRV